ncbi:hypothetical protein Gotri_007790 [Gossypium trilobum]|uniref:Uncharacterized protein n=1 Tax=Gossypium trilobum TaxID=34281 RepID=A0A7J9EH86_9ROSI|nr:hypothetical protein [Gossypium trilobum]
MESLSWKRDFLIKWKTMRLYSTVTMVICLIYSMSKWISTYFEL